MYEYSHGGNAVFEIGKRNIIDLSANINPLGMPTSVTSAIISEIPNISRYPDNFSTLLREKTAAFEDVNADWIFFGNGASDIIFRIPRAVSAAKVMVCAPTFSDYERSARSYGAEVVYHTLQRDNDFILDTGFIDTVRSTWPTLVYICNPNNPTGKLTKPQFIKKLLDCCKEIGTWVAIDECFIDFTTQADIYTSKIFLKEYPNLIILKAFTKIFALPGLRIGYALCSDKTLISSLYAHGADWAVSNIAQAAGISALEYAKPFIAQTVNYVSAERTAIENTLTKLGYTVFESSANYVFFSNPHPFDLRRALDKKGIRIRSCSNYISLDNSYYRIAVSTKEHNIKLLKAMEDIANGK